MGTFSIWHWLIVLVVVLVLFGGGGKLSKLMGDAGKGINAFKKGLKESGKDADSEEKPEVAAQQSIEQDAAEEKDKKAASG